MHDGVIIDSTFCISQNMNPTSPRLSSRSGLASLSPAIHQRDFENLVEINFLLYPLNDAPPDEIDLPHSYSIFIYPSAILAALRCLVNNDAGELPWEFWGANNSACFTDAFDPQPDIAHWDGCGD